LLERPLQKLALDSELTFEGAGVLCFRTPLAALFQLSVLFGGNVERFTWTDA